MSPPAVSMASPIPPVVVVPSLDLAAAAGEEEAAEAARRPSRGARSRHRLPRGRSREERKAPEPSRADLSGGEEDESDSDDDSEGSLVDFIVRGREDETEEEMPSASPARRPRPRLGPRRWTRARRCSRTFRRATSPRAARAQGAAAVRPVLLRRRGACKQYFEGHEDPDTTDERPSRWKGRRATAGMAAPTTTRKKSSRIARTATTRIMVRRRKRTTTTTTTKPTTPTSSAPASSAPTTTRSTTGRVRRLRVVDLRHGRHGSRDRAPGRWSKRMGMGAVVVYGP